MNTVTNFGKFALVMILFTLSLGSVFAEPTPSQDQPTLASFQLEEEAQQVVLTWEFEKVAQGVRTYVERAGMNMQFNPIGEVDSKNDHRFVDEQPQQKLSFYRLVTQNADGSMTYHTTIAINR